MAYDPREHIRVNYPTWFVTLADLGGVTHELVSPAGKLIILDPAAFGGSEDMAYAHAAAHMDGDAGRIDKLTEQDCYNADCLARLRMDRPEDRDWDGAWRMVELDGEATQPI